MKNSKNKIELTGNEIIILTNLISDELKRNNYFDRNYEKPIKNMELCKALLNIANKFEKLDILTEKEIKI